MAQLRTDISLLDEKEMESDPINLADVANEYKEVVYPEVGIPHRKKLRHMSVFRLQICRCV